MPSLHLIICNYSHFESPYTAFAVNPTGTKVYVTGGNKVIVIDTATNNVTSAFIVGNVPNGIAVNPTGTKVYVTISDSSYVSVIDTVANNVIARIDVGSYPYGVAVNPAGTKVYVASLDDDNISVIDTATNNVTAKLPVENGPLGVAVSSDGKKVYVTNLGGTVSVINTTTNTLAATIDVGLVPEKFAYVGIPPIGITISSDGNKAYVTNPEWADGTVSVIDIATDNVTAKVNVGLLYKYYAALAHSTESNKANQNTKTNSARTIPAGFNFLILIAMITLYIWKKST